MAIDINGQVGPQTNSDGAKALLRLLRDGSLGVSEIQGRYYEMAARGNLFTAHAIVTAPVIYTTAAGTGGPLLYNGSANKNAVLIAAGFGVTVVTTVAAALGIATGVTTAPTSTTAIDSTGNCLVGGAASNCTAYRIGTVSAAAPRFVPFAHLHTGALTVDTFGMNWIDLGGLIVVPPGGFASISASATASTTVMSAALVWAEVPV